MDPCIWGPIKWNLISECVISVQQHIQYLIKEGYKNVRVNPTGKINIAKIATGDMRDIGVCKMSLLTYINYLYIFLPCPACSHDAKEYISTNPFPINNLNKWIKWIYDFKDYVNRKRGIESSISYDQFENRLRIISGLVAWSEVFDFFLIFAANIDIIHSDIKHDKEEIALMYEKIKTFFIGLSNVIFISPTLKTLSPFLLVTKWKAPENLNASLFKNIYNNAVNYEIDLQARIYLKQTGIESINVNKDDYVPYIFGMNVHDSLQRYRLVTKN